MHVPEEHQKSILMRLFCGALAGLFGQTVTYPLDVVKRQMQVLQHNFMSSRLSRTIFSLFYPGVGGGGGLGLSSLISSAFFFSGYISSFRTPFLSIWTPISISMHSIAEAFSHLVSVQVGSLQNVAHENARYRNTFDGLRTIVRSQGWRQLFAGVSINYIRVIFTLLSFIQLNYM